eukprot:Nk52_evm14s2171 gene=Nk52_evmTU14s2171
MGRDLYTIGGLYWGLVILVLGVGCVSGYFVGLDHIETGQFSPEEALPGRPFLSIGGLFPLSTNDGDPERLSAAKAAVMMINNSTKYNFTLKMQYADTMRNPTATLNAAIPMLLNDEQEQQAKSHYNSSVFGIIGPASSSEAKALAPVLSSFGVLCVSYSATSPDLSNSRAYPNFVRTIPADSGGGLAIANLVSHLQWKRVAILSSNDEYGNGISNQLASSLHLKMVDVVMWKKFFVDGSDEDTRDSLLSAMSDLWTIKPRVIILTCFTSYGKMALRIAKMKDLYGAKIQWIFADGLTSDRFVFDDDTKTVDFDLYSVAKGAIGVRPSIGVTSEGENPTLSKFLNLWETLHEKDYDGAGSRIAGIFSYYAADAVFTLANLAQKLIESKKYTVETLPLADFDPLVEEYQTFRLINRTLAGLDFEGVTGRVQFDGNGDRVGPFDIVNLQKPGKFEVVGKLSFPEQEVVNLSSSALLFYDNSTSVVNDGTIYWENYQYSDALRITAMVVTGLSMLGTAVLAVKIWSMKTVRIIKAASVNFLLLVCVGVFICYGSIIVLYFEPTKFVCTFQNDLQHIGFYVAFLAVFLKTYRLRSLLNNQSQKSSRLTDKRLLTIMGFIIVAIILYLCVFSIVLPIGVEEIIYSERTETAYHSNIDKDAELDIYVFYRSCEISWWSFALFVVSLLFLAYCGFISFTLKDSPIGFNEGKFIGFAVYNWAFIRVVLGFIIQFTTLNPDLWFALAAIQTWFTSTALLLLLFGPKFYYIKKGRGDSLTSFGGLSLAKQSVRRPMDNNTVPRAKYRHLSEQFKLYVECNTLLKRRVEECECCDNSELLNKVESLQYDHLQASSSVEIDGQLSKTDDSPQNTLAYGASLGSSSNPSASDSKFNNVKEMCLTDSSNGRYTSDSRSNSGNSLDTSKLKFPDNFDEEKKPDGKE